MAQKDGIEIFDDFDDSLHDNGGEYTEDNK